MANAYPRTYRAIREMVKKAILEVPVCRAIARKGLKTIGAQEAALFGTRLFGQWAVLDAAGKDAGFSFFYSAGSDEFDMPAVPGGQPTTPGGSGEFLRYADSRGLGEGRLVVNVLEAGEAGSTLEVGIEAGGFIGLAPSCPLDSTGLHVSGWEEIVVPVLPLDPNSALVHFIVKNPTEGGSEITLGVVQFQVR